MSRRIVFAIGLLILFLVAGELYGAIIAQWAMALKWHLLNGNKVVFHDMTVHLPYRWWPDSQEGKRMILTAVAPDHVNFYGLVIIEKKSVSKEQLFAFKAKKKINDREVKFEQTETGQIGGEQAFGIVFSSASSRGIEYEFWTIPERHFVISCFAIPVKYKDILAGLLSGISFLEQNMQERESPQIGAQGRSYVIHMPVPCFSGTVECWYTHNFGYSFPV